MRGIGSTLSRLPAARAFLAGAALLASAAAGKAYAQTQPGADDSAMAIPRVSPHSGAGIALPQPLPPSEAARIRRIFTAQRRGDIPAALRDTEGLDTDLTVGDMPLGQAMLGHILADRYLGRFTRPSADDLQAWLAAHGELPDAAAIHSLLVVRLPKGAKPPPVPPGAAASFENAHLPAAPPAPVPEETEQPDQAIARNYALDRSVHEAARSGRPDAVGRLLARTRGLSPVYASLLRGEAGQIMFTLNRDAEAFDVASEGANTCGHHDGCQNAALAGYAAGLAAWRMGRPELARPMFEAAWRAEYTTSSLRAASAFWAARTHLRTGDPLGYIPWMNRAASERHSFYGLLARRTLGLGFRFGPNGREDRETLGEADVAAVAATPEGMRAFALLQVGQDVRAEAELRRLWPAAQNTPALGRAIMLVAQAAHLSTLASQLADLVQSLDGRPRDDTRFQIPDLHPNGGFKVDPAMVYALARTESNFDPTLVSSAGARGLMQIMPDTANFITHANVSNPDALLHDPEYNLDLGQRYVAYLATHEMVAGDLIKLLASYNSGPGNFTRWSANLHDSGDPLLFIEAIPIDETRNFVPRVLTYTWIYATRMRLPTPSLDELAAGGWPRYHPMAAVTEAARLH